MNATALKNDAIEASALYRGAMVSFLAAAFFLLTSHGAYADFGDLLCATAVTISTGNLGRGVASIAVIVLGLGCMIGKVSWTMAILLGIGISIVFGWDSILGSYAC